LKEDLFAGLNLNTIVQEKNDNSHVKIPRLVHA